MARGDQKVYYQSDILTMFDSTGAAVGAQFVTERPADQVAQAPLGWSTSPPVALAPTDIRLPRRLRPRHAVGVDTSGRRHKVDIAKLTASAWGDPTLTWTIVDNGGTTDTVTVTGFVGEATTI